MTVSIEAVMLTAKICALKGRDVDVVEITGEYLSADMDDKVYVVFRVTLEEMMVASNLTLY